MNNKIKIILIAVEVFVLVVLLLLGVGCQQRWIIVTGNGPRFDWYAKDETDPILPDVEDTAGSSKPEPSESEESTTVPSRPAVTPPPETTEPSETTQESTGPPESTVPADPVIPTDDWETDEF